MMSSVLLNDGSVKKTFLLFCLCSSMINFLFQSVISIESHGPWAEMCLLVKHQADKFIASALG